MTYVINFQKVSKIQNQQQSFKEEAEKGHEKTSEHTNGRTRKSARSRFLSGR